MKEGNAVYIDDLRIKGDEKTTIYGRIRFIKENDIYIDIYLDTGYKVTIDKSKT